MNSYRSCDAERLLDRTWLRVTAKAFWNDRPDLRIDMDELMNELIGRVADLRDAYRRGASVG